MQVHFDAAVPKFTQKQVKKEFELWHFPVGCVHVTSQHSTSFLHGKSQRQQSEQEQFQIEVEGSKEPCGGNYGNLQNAKCWFIVNISVIAETTHMKQCLL